MRGNRMRAAVIGLVAGLGVASSVGAAPFRPFPQHVPLAAGTILPSHRTQAQLDADVRGLYDAWKTRYLAQAGTDAGGHPRYRILFSRSPSAQTVSEGQGYGMLIAPLMAGYDPNAQTIFDGLWTYAKDHRSTIDPRLMDWKVAANEVPDANGNDSAFDGDADIALGLLLAEAQWGNGGRYDYGAEATWVIGGIRDSTIGPSSHLPMLGDWVDPNGSQYSQWTTRTSDFMLDDFRAYAAKTGDPVWPQVIDATHAAITRMQSVYSPSTGLAPDFLQPMSASDTTLRPADPGFLEGPDDGHYAYNAVRVPWRLGLDAALHGDATSRQQAQKISHWAETATGGNPQMVFAVRRLDGTLAPGNNYFTTVFAATLGVAAMLDAGQQSWLNALYDAVRQSDEGYYEDTLSLLCLLSMTGNFWSAAGAAPVCGNGVVEAGETCDDGNLVDGDGCDSNCTVTACGNGIRTAGEACDDGNLTAGDCCSPTCQLEATGSPCDDGDPCTNVDACNAGTCGGVFAPASGCAAASGGRLTLKDQSGRPRQLSWQWSGTGGAFGDPVGGGTRYALCLYDTAGGMPSLRVRAAAPAGGFCGSKPCWKATSTGFVYRSATELAGGMRQLSLKAAGGRTSITVQAKGGNLPALGLPLAQDPAVTVQLKTSGGVCWEMRSAAPASHNDSTRFVDGPG